MMFAYADPPYIGQAKKHYAHDARCAEVHHPTLIAELCGRYDGWALSCSTPSLGMILPMCPDGVRVGAWVKPFCAFKANVNPAYAWEPVIFYKGRRRTRKQPTERDWLSCGITLKKGLSGAKPKRFCFWIFEMLGMQTVDDLVDLYLGTGIVGIALEEWKQWSKL